MRYLGNHLQRAVLGNIEQARKIWRGAFENGVNASQKRDWKAALSFLGTAYEVGVLRLQLERRSPMPSFTAEHTVSSGRYLANAMLELDKKISAEKYLKEIFEMLTEICLDKHSSDVQRYEAFFHAKEFRHCLVRHLEKYGRRNNIGDINDSFKKTERLALAEIFH